MLFYVMKQGVQEWRDGAKPDKGRFANRAAANTPLHEAQCQLAAEKQCTSRVVQIPRMRDVQ